MSADDRLGVPTVAPQDRDHRLLRAECGQGDARRAPALDRHRRRRGAAAGGSATTSCGRTTSATGAPRSACSSSTCSTSARTRRARALDRRPQRLLPGRPGQVRRRPGFAERSRQRVVALQAGDATTLRLWRLLVAESEQYFLAVYDRLGVTPDAGTSPASAYNDMLAPSSTSSQRPRSAGARATARSAPSRPGSPAARASRCRSSSASATAASATAPPTWPRSVTGRRIWGRPGCLRGRLAAAPAPRDGLPDRGEAGWLRRRTGRAHVAFGRLGAGRQEVRPGPAGGQAGRPARGGGDRAAAVVLGEPRPGRRPTRPPRSGRSASARSNTPTSPATGSRTTSSTGTGCWLSTGDTGPYLHTRTPGSTRSSGAGGVTPDRARRAPGAPPPSAPWRWSCWPSRRWSPSRRDAAVPPAHRLPPGVRGAYTPSSTPALS